MLIDWFTVGAQAINFIVLVWLLKRFLYKPILNAIDSREKRVAAELADADRKEAEAQKERDEFFHKNEQFDRQRADLLKKAMEEAAAERERLFEEVRKDADAERAKRQQALEADTQTLNRAIRRRVRQEVFAIARKTLGDLASVDLEVRMGQVFVDRLRAMDATAKERLARAVGTSPEPALVRSAFDLPAEQRTAIQRVLNDIVSAEVPLRFETAPDLVGGIELSANGQKIAWSVDDYLGSLERSVGGSAAIPEQPKLDATRP